MMYAEEDLLPISGLQHLAFCERQWGLIHLEQAWSENVLTAEGRVLHEKAHDGQTESRGDTRIARSMRLRSLRLGLAGVADVVEFQRLEPTSAATPAGPPPTAIRLAGCKGLWRPFPVEYKRGRPKAGDFDKIQLCAQTLCLEEMLACSILMGALFYGQPHKRTDVPIDKALRRKTEYLAERMHAIFSTGITPAGIYEKKCKSCSLLEICRPEKIKASHSAHLFLARQLAELEEDAPS